MKVLNKEDKKKTELELQENEEDNADKKVNWIFKKKKIENVEKDNNNWLFKKNNNISAGKNVNLNIPFKTNIKKIKSESSKGVHDLSNPKVTIKNCSEFNARGPSVNKNLVSGNSKGKINNKK